MPSVVVTSDLAAPPAAVWRHARTMAGVNEELWPFVRMTVPPAARALTLEDVALGSPAFTSSLLAAGLVPFDRHHLTLVRVERDRGFLERSHSLLQRTWEHERILEPAGAGTRVTDRVRFEPRMPGAGLLAGRLVAALFRHRHRRLSARFGRL